MRGWRTRPSVEYLQQLGITAVELMPVHHFVHDGFLLDRGLRNYWGYNSIGFFAPHAAVRRADPMRRRDQRVPARWSSALHRAGIEVILDVVYNHTAEGNHRGPTLSSAASTTRLLPAAAGPARATTSTTRAPATAEHRRIRTCCS